MNDGIKIVFLLILFGLQNTFAQTDTLISYTPSTKQFHNYTPIKFDTSIIFNNTGWNYGSEPGFDSLKLTSPDSTYNNSGFIDYKPAHNFFSVNNYPARTAIKLFLIKNDSLKQNCSGILVAKNYVLTSCHCIGKYDSNYVFQFYDSISISPAFDNGRESPLFGSSLGTEYFTFKSNIANLLPKDIALIKLKVDIGIKTGWVGIAFSKDDNYYKDRVFHSFSYPGRADPTDSTRIFNGDTLYYNYGTLDLIENNWLGFNIWGIPGQSGNSLIYTNNKEYYSFGTLDWSNDSQHIRISPEIFNDFKSILDNSVANVAEDKKIVTDYYLSEAYPNPFNPSTRINYTISNSGLVILKVFDVLGREVQTLVNGTQAKGRYEITFNANGLSSGIYFYRLESGDFISTKKMILLK